MRNVLKIQSNFQSNFQVKIDQNTWKMSSFTLQEYVAEKEHSSPLLWQLKAISTLSWWFGAIKPTSVIVWGFLLYQSQSLCFNCASHACIVSFRCLTPYKEHAKVYQIKLTQTKYQNWNQKQSRDNFSKTWHEWKRWTCCSATMAQRCTPFLCDYFALVWGKFGFFRWPKRVDLCCKKGPFWKHLSLKIHFEWGHVIPAGLFFLQRLFFAKKQFWVGKNVV